MAGRHGRTVALAAALLSIGACAQAEPAQAPAAAAPAAAPAAAEAPASAVHRFKIGAYDAMVLLDGGGAFPNNGKIVGIDEGPEKVAAVLKAAGVPTDVLQLSINVLLVKVGERTFLFDTGNGPKAAGKLPASLTAAGVTPAQVTDIVISHGHGDHIGGLVTAEGGPAFPNARVHVTAAEWESIKGSAEAPAAVAAVKGIGDKVVTFQPGAVLAPGVTAVELRGHTPGHTGVLIESGGQSVLAIGDAAHHYVVSVREPEFTIQFDRDAPTAEATRRALWTRAVDEKLTVFAPHFPYPGLGTVRTEGDGFAWVAKP